MTVQQNVRFTLFQYLLNIKDYKYMTCQVTFKCWDFTFSYVEYFLDFKDREFEKIYIHIFNFILFLNFTILYWFCHISKWIRHRHTRVPHREPSSLLPPHTIPLGRPSAPAPSIQYRALILDWRFVSYMILYIFQCRSPKSSHPLPLPESKRLFYTSVSLLLSRILGYCYHLSKFHIYALVYCIGVFLSGLLHSV